MHPDSAVSFPSFKIHEGVLVLDNKWQESYSTLHLNQMSSMREYNSCNYNFTVLPIFTIEEENK